MSFTVIITTGCAALVTRHPPYLVPPHEHRVLPAEGLDLLIQVHVSLMVPLEHHVAWVLEPKKTTTKKRTRSVLD